jgi:hypothetical protein
VETSSTQQLNRYSAPTSIAGYTSDLASPLSYQDWYAAYRNLIPGQEYRQYNDYLTNWYKNKTTDRVTTADQIRQNYLLLLKQLHLFIPNQELEEWYNQVNIYDEKELLLAIPYYAKKLRDIALYYCQLRDKLQKTKLQYNLVGSNIGLYQNIITDILTNYTQRPNSSITVPASVWNAIPQLSAIKDTISLTIEDLYDFQTYLGQSPTVSVSSYFNLTDEATTNYFADLGLSLSSSEWIYSAGNLDLSADPIYIDTLGLNIAQVQNFITSKYLGENKYSSSVPPVSTNTDYYSLSVLKGNNFFYWPGSTYYDQALNTPYYNPIPLSSAGLQDATAGSDITTADTIFIKHALGIEGAWYKRTDYTTGQGTMNAVFNSNSQTVFRYPFPGYGLSGEDVEWTGYSTSTTQGYNYLEEVYKNAVQRAYWSNTTLLSYVNPVNINDTQLIYNNGNGAAYASKDYNAADKIKVQTKVPAYTDNIFSGDVQEAWLYSMYNTDIPIAGNNTVSTVLWPYQRIVPTSTFPTNIPSDITKSCSPVRLSDINIRHATASNDIKTADKIFKLANYTSDSTQATECAWLSGAPFDTGDVTGCYQPGLNCYFQAGFNTQFIWQDTTYPSANKVFPSINHQSNCSYITSNLTYLSGNACTCRSVLFTPFGHPGDNLTDNNQLADFIALANTDQHNSFDLNTWVDDDGNDYTTSPDFTWFRTNNTIGWGDGYWVNPYFGFKPNRVYVYGRANVFNVDPSKITLPALVTRYPYSNNKTVWLKGTKQPDGTWINSNLPSDMIIRAGDVLRFERPGLSTFTKYTYHIVPSQITNNINGTSWMTYDYVDAKQTVYVSYPYDSNIIVNQFIQWTVTNNETSETTTYNNVPSFSFSPTVTGHYTITLHALTGTTYNANVSAVTTTTKTVNNGVTSYNTTTDIVNTVPNALFTNIPVLSVVSPYTNTTTLTTYLVPTPGYVLNVPLNGWNYNTSNYDTNGSINQGARPFWAIGNNSKDAKTQYKGFISYGTPQKFVDGHNLITQPDISTIVLSAGNYIRYERNYNQPFTWSEPLPLSYYVNSKAWCTLLFNTTAIPTLSGLSKNINTTLITTPLTTPSTMLLRNHINNQPVEVYYNSVNNFIWNITAVPELLINEYATPAVKTEITVANPWTNLTNTFYPTFAVLPFVGSLSSISQFGGFFCPSNLGASYYINKDYTASIVTSSTSLTGLFNNPYIHIGGRGLTMQDQISPYIITEENNAWLKEPVTSGSAAGNIKKSITKKYQKFIPYQSSNETTSYYELGLITPTSRMSPWGGVNDAEWTDYYNKPVSFTGQVNVDNWTNTQILKETNKQLDCWASDIFGNQYGLYKKLDGVYPSDRNKVTGDIWIKKNSRFVSPAYIALSSTFKSYESTFLYNYLTGGITKIDIFFDTLLIQTPGVVYLEKLQYDYNNDIITSIADNSRHISLATPITPSITRELATVPINNENNFKQLYPFRGNAGETWFLPQEKIIVLSFNDVKDYIIAPELYQYNINTISLTKTFPTLQQDFDILQSLSFLQIISVDPPIISHNSVAREYVLAFLGTSITHVKYLFELKISDTSTPTIINFNVYQPT